LSQRDTEESGKNKKIEAEKLSIGLLSSGQDFGKKFLDSKHVFKVQGK